MTVVIVTGASSGIGAAIALRLGRPQMTLVLAARRATELAEVARRVETNGGTAVVVPTDVRDPAAVDTLVARARKVTGRIDALVNNAAVYQGLGAKTPFTDIPVAEWDRVMAVNTRGVWLGMRAVHPVMREHGYGRVVNIASSTVHMGVPYFAHYTASKGAVIALTRSVAREVGADGITVNAVAPGLVETEATRSLNEPGYLASAAGRRAVPRSMVPEDLCPAVAFLCSRHSGFITGQTLVVVGGTVFS